MSTKQQGNAAIQGGDVTTSPDPIRAKSAWVSLVLAGLITVVPFLLPIHRRPLLHFYGEWVAFALGVAACFPLLYRSFWRRLRIPPLAIWLFAMVVLIFLQTFVVDQVYPAQALLPGIYLSWAAALVILSGWIREQLGLDRAIQATAWMICIGGILQASIGLVQFFDIQGQLFPVIEMRDGASIYGNLNQRNLFAAQIVLASFALIYLRAVDRIGRAPAVALLVLFVTMLTASSSRAVAVFLVAGTILSFVFYQGAKTRIHRRLLQGTGILLVLFLVFQYFLPFLNHWLKLLLGALGFDTGELDVLVMSQRNMAEGIDSRIAQWRKAWSMFLESPLWGVGIGHYAWHGFNYQALPEYSGVSKNYFLHHSHNLVMQVLAELGIAGLLLLLFMTATWLRRALPYWKNPSYWLVFALVMVLALHSGTEFPLWYSFFLGPTALLLGLGSGRAIRARFTPLLGQLTFWTVLLLSGVLLVITFRGYQDIRRAYNMFSSSNVRPAPETLRAVAGNPLLTPWAEAAMMQLGSPDRNALDRQLAMVNRVMRHFPNSINVNLHIIYLALANKSAETSALLQKAFIVYPSDFSKFACYWKATPVIEIERLWKEADRLTGGSIECQTADPS